jgi:pimeloyl-ACP methyl ester carboxylesterase
VEVARRAAAWWSEAWDGQSFMAIGMADPVLGPAVMAKLGATIRNCPPPMEIADAGHFVQEWGEPVAREALRAFGGGTAP